MFADVTCLAYTGNDLNILTIHINNRLIAILDWCRFNKLSLNPRKCNYMLVSNKIAETYPDIYLGQTEVEIRVSNFKNLGIQINDYSK